MKKFIIKNFNSAGLCESVENTYEFYYYIIIEILN